MPDGDSGLSLKVLLDQNVPQVVGSWLQNLRPTWQVTHVSLIGLGGATDSNIFQWAQENGYIVISFDEDFADQRSFPVGRHHGVIRLRIWPTTVDETQSALTRLLEQTTESELSGALVIVGQTHIRIRTFRPNDSS